MAPDTTQIDATPKARELAEEQSLPLSSVEGTGTDGRILVSDVQKALDEREERMKATAAKADAGAPAEQTQATTDAPPEEPEAAAEADDAEDGASDEPEAGEPGAKEPEAETQSEPAAAKAGEASKMFRRKFKEGDEVAVDFEYDPHFNPTKTTGRVAGWLEHGVRVTLDNGVTVCVDPKHVSKV